MTAIFAVLVMVAGCRSLTGNETGFLQTKHGANLDYAKVTLRKGGLPDVLPRASALTVGNVIYWQEKTWRDDFNPRPPDVPYTEDLALLAHEITHVWQYQNRSITGYSLEKVIREHREFGDRVYDYPKPLAPKRPFLSYRLEQQGQIVEDWIYWLASGNPEADVYESVIRQVMPIDSLKRAVKRRR